jgi:hypothetical protein
MDTTVSRDTPADGPAAPAASAREGRRAGTPAGPDAVAIAIEEIFLEGDSMTMLRHEAGSAHARELLASAELPASAHAAPNRR